jgi:hypothetical protein
MPYVDIKIKYKGREVKFSQVEFEDEHWNCDNDLNRDWIEEDFIDYFELSISNVQYESNICHHCNGSGEGPADGTSCSFCRGTGVKNLRK